MAFIAELSGEGTGVTRTSSYIASSPLLVPYDTTT